MSGTIRVALAQLTSTDDFASNLQQVKQALAQIDQPVDLVSFPENTFYFRIRKDTGLQPVTLQDPFWQELREWCTKQDCALHIGGTPVSENGIVYNAKVWVTSEGVQTIYRKMHLFDVEVRGQASLRESDFFAKGHEPRTLTLKDWKIGLSICYDLRFAELYNCYAKEEVDLILVPSAFLVKTGEAHWHTLLRARAIENQCYVIAAAQGGVHVSPNSTDTRHTYGHSLAVDPWGEVLVDLKDASGPVVRCVELSKARIHDVRQQIPMRQHRRLWT